MNQNDLPLSWQTVEIRDIADLSGGGTPSRKTPSYFEGTIPWLTGYDLPEDQVVSIYEGREGITEEAIKQSATSIVPAKTVLITTRVTVGKTAVTEVPLCFSQDVTGIQIRDYTLVDPYYLAHCLLAYRERLLRLNRGSTITGIIRSDVARLKIPLPTLPEQERIVEILRRADEVRQLRRRASQRAADLLPALFYDVFGDPIANPKGWEVVQLGTLLMDTPQNGLYKPSSSYGSGTPIVRIADFYAGTLNSPGTFSRVEVSSRERARYELHEGEILINRVNSEEYLGKCALVQNLSEPTVFESNMMRLVVNKDKVSPIYLSTFLTLPYAREQMLRRAKRAINQASINQQDVISLMVPIPDQSTLQLFEKLERSLVTTAGLTASASTRTDDLFQSVLVLAFSGDLTARWRESNTNRLLAAAAERDRLLGISSSVSKLSPNLELTPEELRIEEFDRFLTWLSDLVIHLPTIALNPETLPTSLANLPMGEYTNKMQARFAADNDSTISYIRYGIQLLSESGIDILIAQQPEVTEAQTKFESGFGVLTQEQQQAQGNALRLLRIITSLAREYRRYDQLELGREDVIRFLSPRQRQVVNEIMALGEGTEFTPESLVRKSDILTLDQVHRSIGTLEALGLIVPIQSLKQRVGLVYIAPTLHDIADIIFSDESSTLSVGAEV